MFFPELLLLLFKGPSKPDDIRGIWGKWSISDECEPLIISRLQNNGSPCFGALKPDRITVENVTQGVFLE